MTSLARLRWIIIVVPVAGAVASSLVALLLGGQSWDGLLLNFGTEMAGAVVTYALLELVIGRRERLRQRLDEEAAGIRTRKTELIALLGSAVHDVALPAAEELSRRGWLSDGSVRGANLFGADLTGADLVLARLDHVDLSRANLSGADLCHADLSGANLTSADLSGAFLEETMLQGATLTGVNLSGANLSGAFLSDAALGGANLKRATLRGAEVVEEQLDQAASLEGAMLPDGTVHE